MSGSQRKLQINRLFHKLQYVSQNEETSCLKLVHFYNEDEGIPSEMEANWKSGLLLPFISIQSAHRVFFSTVVVLDEAFPEITIDLVRSMSDVLVVHSTHVYTY